MSSVELDQFLTIYKRDVLMRTIRFSSDSFNCVMLLSTDQTKVCSHEMMRKLLLLQKKKKEVKEWLSWLYLKVTHLKNHRK